MILETGNAIYARLVHSWLNEYNQTIRSGDILTKRSNRILALANWIESQGGIINRVQRKGWQVIADANDILPDIDYIEFPNDQDYFTFILKYL